jgi:hypothetical protein
MKLVIVIFLISFKTIASSEHFSIEFKRSFHSCRETSEIPALPVMTINFGDADAGGNCLDAPTLKCLNKITFFSIGSLLKNMNKMNESVLCQFQTGTPACFEAPFIISPDDRENFLEITDMKFEYGAIVKRDRFHMNSDHVLNRWKKFVQVLDGGCNFQEIEFRVTKR